MYWKIKLVNKRYIFVYFYVIHLWHNLRVVKGKQIFYMKQVDKMCMSQLPTTQNNVNSFIGNITLKLI